MASYANEKCSNCSQEESNPWIIPTCQHRICICCLFENEITTQCDFCRKEKCVECFNASDGCGTALRRNKRDLLEEHFKACEYRKTPCPNNCSVRVSNRDLLYHVDQECPKRLLECNYCQCTFFAEEIQLHLLKCDFVLVKCEFCDQKVFKKEMESHVQGCRVSNWPCEWSRLGCEFKGTFAELQKHAIMNTHAALMVDYMSRSEENMRLLREDVRILQEEVEILKVNHNKTENYLKACTKVVRNLGEDNRLLKKDITTTKHKIQGYSDEISLRNEIIDALRVDVQTLREEKESLMIKMTRAVEDVEHLKAENEELKRRLEQEKEEKERRQGELLTFCERFRKELLGGLKGHDAKSTKDVDAVLSCVSVMKDCVVGMKQILKLIMMNEDVQVVNLFPAVTLRGVMKVINVPDPQHIRSILNLQIQPLSLLSYTFAVGPKYTGLGKEITSPHHSVRLVVRFKFLVREEETDVFAEVSHSSVEAARVEIRDSRMHTILDTTLRNLLTRIKTIPILCGSIPTTLLSLGDNFYFTFYT